MFNTLPVLMFEIFILTFRKICLSENLTVRKFGVGKSVSENSMSENLLSEKSADTDKKTLYQAFFMDR